MIDAEHKRLGARYEAALDARFAPGARVAFVDFPYDTNVGNHMMWLAANQYFTRRKVRLVYPTHINAFDTASLRRVVGDGIIAFNGGVGLSALWPRVTQIKRRIAREFPNNPLVVFPSTVSFRTRAEQDAERDLFAGHKNVFLMARDSRSLAVMRETFQEAESVLVPDSTFILPAQRRRRRAQHEIAWLARNDLEGIGYEAPSGVFVFDWSNRTLVTPADYPLTHYAMRVAGAATRLRRTGVAPARVEASANRVAAEIYRRVSERILRAGNDDMDRGRVIVTDRFHTHILAILRKQPVVLLVDAFGKNESSYESWTHQFANVRLARTPAQALEQARELARRMS